MNSWMPDEPVNDALPNPEDDLITIYVDEAINKLAYLIGKITSEEEL